MSITLVIPGQYGTSGLMKARNIVGLEVARDCNLNGLDAEVTLGDYFEMINDDGTEVVNTDYVRLFYQVRDALEGTA